MQLVNFKTYEWVFSGLGEKSPYWYLDVVGSNPTHGRYYISVVRSLSEFSQPILKKWVSTFGGRESSTLSSVLKYWSMSFANRLLTVIAFALELKPIFDVLDTIVHTNTRIAYL